MKNPQEDNKMIKDLIIELCNYDEEHAEELINNVRKKGDIKNYYLDHSNSIRYLVIELTSGNERRIELA